jgi:uncharacterized protein with HEPN domain
MKNRDNSVLVKIKKYTTLLTETKDMKLTLEQFSSDKTLADASALRVFQIGELSKLLSDEFKKEHSTIPWREIIRMREIIAHHYEKFEMQVLYEVVMEHIPPLHGIVTALTSE